MVAKDCLFDRKERTYTGYPDKGEPHFDFLNRSAWAKVDCVRKTLESWFARIPQCKKNSLRGMFRNDDRLHTGALLELVTHEILCAIGSKVEADPNVHGKTPDYAAKCQDASVIVECTVVQESDRDFDRAQSENASRTGTREPGVSIRVGVLGADFQLSKATKKKSWKYRIVNSPFVLVVGGHRWFSHEHAIIHALFGRNTFRDPKSFFGTSTEPKNVHVSGVLFKSFDAEGSVWDLCRPQLPWEFVHNPRAKSPMKRGMFPFAKEWNLESGGFNEIEPRCTLNEVLGLPNPWPPRGE